MIVAVLLCFDHVHNKLRQVQCVCGSSDLIAHYPDLIVRLAYLQHGLYEIVPVYPENPGNTNYKIFFQNL